MLVTLGEGKVGEGVREKVYGVVELFGTGKIERSKGRGEVVDGRIELGFNSQSKNIVC